MKLKTMMAAFACAAASVFTANAAETWFNGGVAEGWPSAGTLDGGAWSGSTTTSAWSTDRVNIVLDDEKNPVTFTATDPKTLTGDTTADSVEIKSSVGFSAYDYNALPDVPTEAKAGITFMATDDEGATGEFYYLAYDADSGANAWKASGITSAITSGYSAKMLTTTTITKGADGFWSVSYEISTEDVTNPAIVTTVQNTSTGSEAATVGKVVYGGNGPGFLTALTGAYVPATCLITCNADYLAGKHVTVTDVAGATAVAGGWRIAKGSKNVVVTIAPESGYTLAQNTFTIAEVTGNTFEINGTTCPDVPEAKQNEVEITFYNIDNSPMTSNGTQIVVKGVPGDPIPAAVTNMLCYVANMEENWVDSSTEPLKWDGKWYDDYDCITPVDLPSVYPSSEGTTEYWMGYEDWKKGVSVTGVELDITSKTVLPGASFTLTATVSPEDATDKSVSWSTSDEAVATVADGVVTAVAAGEATITVTTTDGGFTATCTVTVEDKPEMDPEQGTIETGTDGIATVQPEDGVTEVTITGDSAAITAVSVPTSVEKITGVDPDKIQLTYTAAESGAKTYNITGAFTKNGDATQGVTYELNPDGSVEVDGELVPVTPTAVEPDPTFGTLDEGAVATKAIPGLTYSLQRKESLQSAQSASVASETATSGTISLKDSFDGGKPASAFYEIGVAK